MNTVSLIGRLTKAPEAKQTPKTEIATFTLAVKNDREGADFIRITVFGKQAKSCCDYLDKGNLVGVQGRLQSGSYEKDGRTIYTLDVIGDRVEFLSPKNTHESDEKRNIGESYSNNDFFGEKPF